ncbi:class I SAM-dependent methyltransferase [Paenibacillus puldeungensis]|uniref:Class I SAM-dependent methyltransferase n=1 Tax=Paenibacillus puldeungensis TaxID=696536 RepID=A0ABW3RZY1_9BACL
MDTSSNEIWMNASNYDDWETSRPLLFRDDMREMFFKWFRVTSSDQVLDCGCGTGVLTRFIAKGLYNGFITGFDLSRHFVDYGNVKIKEEGLDDKARILREDGYNLSFDDNSFDVIVNHAYLGVLSDNVAGLKEMIRVCKHGGHVSASVSARSFPKINWDGDCPFPYRDQLNELLEKQERIYQKITTFSVLKQDSSWNVMRFPKMFSMCGLKNITFHPYASGFSYSDSYWPDDFKKYLIKTGVGREIEILEQERENPLYAENHFTNEEFNELIHLYNLKQDHLIENINNHENWDWNASMHYIVTGTKP